jgi:hypothetical protein
MPTHWPSGPNRGAPAQLYTDVSLKKCSPRCKPNRLQLHQRSADGRRAHGRLRQVHADPGDHARAAVGAVDRAVHVNHDAPGIGQDREIPGAGDRPPQCLPAPGRAASIRFPVGFQGATQHVDWIPHRTRPSVPGAFPLSRHRRQECSIQGSMASAVQTARPASRLDARIRSGRAGGRVWWAAGQGGRSSAGRWLVGIVPVLGGPEMAPSGQAGRFPQSVAS